MYEMISGTFEYVRDRVITVNGVLLGIPKTGYACAGIELVFVDGMMVPHVRVLDGPGGARFSVLRIGEGEFRNIKGMCEQREGEPVPFSLMTPLIRPKVTTN